MNTKIELKSELYKLARLGKSSFIYEIVQNRELDFDERYMENNQIISVYDKENNFINEYEFDEDENYLDPLNRNVPHIFTLYNRLSPAQRSHLLDFSIIYSIENACEKEFNQEEKGRLLVMHFKEMIIIQIDQQYQMKLLKHMLKEKCL